MAKRPLDGAKYSPWQVLSSANAFYALSCVYTDRLPKDVTHPNPQFGTLADAQASATNRILGLELYLKAMLVGVGAQFPADHDLVVLFRALPVDVQNEVEEGYNKRRTAADDPDAIVGIIIGFQLTDSPDQTVHDLPEPNAIDRSLAGLLERNRKGFVEARYLFGQASFDTASLFVYEHLRIAILCGVLCKILETSLPNRSERYNRSFLVEGWDN
jgi:hypothetical protein